MKEADPQSEIPRLLRRAFDRAKAGDEVGARAAWEEAIGLGYVILPKTAQWLEKQIRYGKAEQGRIANRRQPQE